MNHKNRDSLSYFPISLLLYFPLPNSRQIPPGHLGLVLVAKFHKNRQRLLKIGLRL